MGVQEPGALPEPFLLPAAMKVAQEQPWESDLEPQHLGKVGCPLEVLLGRGRLAEAELEQKRSLPLAEAGQVGEGTCLWVADNRLLSS